MVLAVSARVTGDAEVQRLLSKLERKHGGVIKKIIRKTTLNVENRAKHIVPVITGRLRSSITHEFKSQDTPARHIGVVGSNVEYAPFVEFGGAPTTISVSKQWALNHARAPGLDGQQLRLSGKAKPYLFPALRRESMNMVKALKRAIKTLRP